MLKKKKKKYYIYISFKTSKTKESTNIGQLGCAYKCQNHKLLIYDLRTSKDLSKALTLPLELKASEKLIPFPLTSVAFNGINQGLIGTGDGFGRVHVWKLTSKLMSKNPDEIQILNNIGDTKEDWNK